MFFLYFSSSFLFVSNSEEVDNEVEEVEVDEDDGWMIGVDTDVVAAGTDDAVVTAGTDDAIHEVEKGVNNVTGDVVELLGDDVVEELLGDDVVEELLSDDVVEELLGDDVVEGLLGDDDEDNKEDGTTVEEVKEDKGANFVSVDEILVSVVVEVVTVVKVGMVGMFDFVRTPMVD
jgi:hypothetical protein